MLYPVMMSGSTVLKNSAQLCSQRCKQKHNGMADDQQNIKKREQGKRQNIYVFQCLTEASVYTCSSCFSCVKHNIWEPTMLAQDWRVNTVRMKGSVSPCRCTIDAIWITGSLSASGKIPGKKRVDTRVKLCICFSSSVIMPHRQKVG